MSNESWFIAYEAIVNSASADSYAELSAFLAQELPYEWYDNYKQNCNHSHNVVRVKHRTFEYIFDECSLTQNVVEARLIAVIGFSEPPTKSRYRDDLRLRGWIGPTTTTFGENRDKGHFIAHSIGGDVDGMEMNVFPQNRLLNRGHSEEGKLFVEMEKYCARNPGTLCFNRPFYSDDSAQPSSFEYGVLKTDLTLWVNVFDNK